MPKKFNFLTWGFVKGNIEIFSFSKYNLSLYFMCTIQVKEQFNRQTFVHFEYNRTKQEIK